MIRFVSLCARHLAIFVRQFAQDQVTFLAAGLCYFITFSTFPLLLVLIALIGFFLSYEEASRHTLQLAREVFPHQSEMVTEILSRVGRHHQEASLIGLLTLLWSGKNVFGAMASAMNMMWGVRPRPWLWENLRATAAALSIGVVIVTLSLAGTLYGAWSTWGAAWLGAEWWAYPPAALQRAASLGPALVASMTLTVLYRWLPNREVPWRLCLLSATIVAAAWEILRKLFGWYLQHVAALDAIYGSLGGVLGFMLWIYLSAILVLTGVEIAKTADQALSQKTP
jgi:membrane protein